ncbi:MAG: LysR family transcriptional regulator [Lysobacteraceae bacterium]
MSPRPTLSLEAIYVVDAIARHGSFAKAAAELHKVPSALSYTVGQLERELGIRLFERTKQQTRLTPGGKDLLEEGRRLLDLAAAAARRLGRIAAGWETDLCIVIDSLLGTQRLFPALRAFYGLATSTRVRIAEESLEGCWEALVEHRADLVIAGLGAGGIPSGGGYVVATLGAVAFDFAVAPGHPLAIHAEALGAPLPESAVLPHRAVRVADSSRARPARTYGLLAGQETLTVASMAAKLDAQRAGLGVGFLPRFLAAPEFERGTLLRLDVQQPRPEAVFALAYRASALGRAGQWFAERLTREPLMDGWTARDSARP